MSKLKIINAKAKDLPVIIELWNELMQYHYDLDVIWEKCDDGNEIFSNYVKKLLKSETANILLAVMDDRIIGFVMGMVSKHPPVLKNMDYGLITDIIISSKYRKNGVGEKLLQEMIKWFKSIGMNRVELGVAKDNEIGYLFWKKNGFKDYMHKLYLEI